MRSCLKIVTSEDEGKLVSTIHFIYFFRDNFFKKYLFIYLAASGLRSSNPWHAESLVVACKLLVVACGI